MGENLERLKKALELAAMGFHVFPVHENSKKAAITDFPNKATRDEGQIKKWWGSKKFEKANIGISTTRFNGSKALVVVDIDNKDGKKGDEEVFKLELEGKYLPDTLTQITPNGGKHLIYVADRPVTQGHSVLGEGIDIRSRGGYVVGVGSVLDGKQYQLIEEEIAEVPQWVIDKCGRSADAPANHSVIETDEALARTRAISFLKEEAKPAIQGQGGQFQAVMVARTLHDIGVDQVEATELMLEHWNDKCEPPWDAQELSHKVQAAYKNVKKPQGADAPEAHFKTIVNPEVKVNISKLSPLEELNCEFLYLSKNSEVLWETVNAKNEQSLVYLSIPGFHNHLLSKRWVPDGAEKPVPVSQSWMKSPKRRSFTDTCFLPEKTAPKNFYNLWRGFSVQKRIEDEEAAKAALDDYLDHILYNICGSDEDHFNWVVGYFAHLIQKPYEKPLTALVFKGEKGTGKNVVVNCINRLVKGHAIIVSNKRYLTGNFNSHLETLLLFTLDEAFWSGDKQSEGILKDLITGEHHFIERKGYEPYSVDNLTRVVVIGNEDWIVPASQDERRFAVFNVGNGRKQDVAFFDKMMKGMNLGGLNKLFHYLKSFDLSKINLNVIPKTEGLLEQKSASLDPLNQMWLGFLEDGHIPNTQDVAWPEYVQVEEFWDLYKTNLRDRNIRSWIQDKGLLGRKLRAVCPSIKKVRTGSDGNRVHKYTLPTLENARLEWEHFIGQKVKWRAISDG